MWINVALLLAGVLLLLGIASRLITGLAAARVLGLPLLQGLLVGSIVGSTAAAAVFSVLRGSGLRLPDRLTATLEVESGSSDPMAIFLTLGLIGVITGAADSAPELLGLFLGQFGVGTIAGLLVGRLATAAINRLHLDYPGLYPLLALAYRAVRHVGAAQLPQPPAGGGPGGGADRPGADPLILVARPIAVWASLWPFRFRRRELSFLSWVGLKGAVPFTLATFPLLAGVPNSAQMFKASAPSGRAGGWGTCWRRRGPEHVVVGHQGSRSH